MASAQWLRRTPWFTSVLLLAMAAVFLVGGARLAALGGSLYYVLSGIALLVAAVLLWRRHVWGAYIYGLFLLATLVWGLAEVGADLWALQSRLLIPLLLGLWLLVPRTRRKLGSERPGWGPFGGAAVAVLVIGTAIGFASRAPVNPMPARFEASTPAPDTEARTDWQHYGNTNAGTRYARLDQITPDNAGELVKLWEYRTGRPGAMKGTPIQIGDLLYACAAFNVIIALDAETGEKRWEFDPEFEGRAFGFTQNCRGVTYHRASDDYAGACPERIITATTDARMFAVDAHTGERCAGFGDDGEISLLPGMGEVKPGFYYVTSPATIARDVAIVGGWVVDNVEVGEPSGVVRAFNVMTGELAWAWDMGRPGINTLPPEGETYTRGTPNVWSMTSYDDELGLIYAPTGNATPDYWGMHRTPVMEAYTSSIVALDVTDGSVRWSFRTVHHDLWDYDVPSQPVLIDLPQADGSVVPALVQATKRGELFLLDRRTGAPIAAVEERPVPQDPAPGEVLSPTQPFSVGMPHFRDDLSEGDMWGMSPFDQLWCRIEFRKVRYDGHFTPPTVGGSLQYPGNAGGFNWGSVSVHEDHRLLVGNPLLFANRVYLTPQDQIPPGGRSNQRGTPYSASTRRFMSPLDMPCTRPPFSRLAVIDLQTQQILWNRPLGTTNESGPLGTRIRVALPMGVPVQAGNLVTQGGLIFIGGTQDRYFRAIDLMTGKELWRDYLPGAAQATPMSYRAPRSGRQVVVIPVPGVRRFGAPSAEDLQADAQDGRIIAYGLPDR